MSMTRITVLLNRGGGAVQSDPSMAKNVAETFRALGVDADVELIDGGSCAERCKALVERGSKQVVVGGGDGTISAAASALVGSGASLGILPLGTLNHFAKDLKIPDSLADAAKLIASGTTRQVDVAEMNERIFVNNSAIGLYPRLVLDRDLQRRKLGRSKRWAMIVASFRTLGRFGHQRLTLTVNDEEARVDTPLLFVGNNDYRLDLGAAGTRESVEDGVLSVFVMRKKTRRGFVAASIRALLNRERPDDMVRLEQVERLRVSSREPVLFVSLDGEVVHAKPPLEYRIRKKALRVIAP